MNKRGNSSNLIDLTAEVPGTETPRSAPEPKPPPHPAGCWCVECHNAGVRYADYLAAKSAQDWWEGA